MWTVGDSLTEVDFQIQGVSDIKRDDQEITFHHSGNINDVINVDLGRSGDDRFAGFDVIRASKEERYVHLRG